MAVKYAIQQQGVADGTAIPPDKADARETAGRRITLLASKEAGVAWANGDTIYLGRKPAGFKIADVKGNTGTSFATSTLSVGIGDDPRGGTTAIADATKYVNAKTLTATDTPTSIGPKASTADDAPGGEEHLWLTIGTADIVAATVATLAIEMAGLNS